MGRPVAPKRRSTQATIRSRTISPEMPAVVADQAMISRSQASMANRMRTMAPSRQCDLEMVGAPTDVGAQRDHDAVVGSARPAGGVALQGQTGIGLQDAEHALAVDGRLALGAGDG